MSLSCPQYKNENDDMMIRCIYGFEHDRAGPPRKISTVAVSKPVRCGAEIAAKEEYKLK